MGAQSLRGSWKEICAKMRLTLWPSLREVSHGRGSHQVYWPQPRSTIIHQLNAIGDPTVNIINDVALFSFATTQHQRIPDRN